MSTQSEDYHLIDKTLCGDKKSLEQLVKKHQTWIYNVALNFTANTDDALDVMQEVLVKIVTNLSKFKKDSEFRTWVYRIIKNHFLNEKRSKYKQQIISWTEFANGLESIKDNYSYDSEDTEKRLVVEEAKLSCMKAMLLCLSPEQRLIFIIGELFETSDTVAAEILDLTKDNFRKKLSRARTQLYTFMNNKCGLINKNNPCRCARKTVGFIERGYVNPENLQFQKSILNTIDKVAESKLSSFQKDTFKEYQRLFQSQYYQEPENWAKSLEQLFNSEQVRSTFNLN
uniref:RNA polymerase sigma factor n=1 Tax=Fulvivirga sp. TaxID=1931237 RepID=UPI00404B2C6C